MNILYLSDQLQIQKLDSQENMDSIRHQQSPRTISAQIANGMDFILPGVTSFVVIIGALSLFVVDIVTKGVKRVVTDHQCLPAQQYKGEVPYGGPRVLTD